jgi:lipopolysaccharide/colanic/teichoic acid biosynthesis glycosyltransferase
MQAIHGLFRAGAQPLFSLHSLVSLPGAPARDPQPALPPCWSISAAKRAFDLLVAVLALAAFALPMLAIALYIRLASGGPVLFAQKRVGRAGRLFFIYKFRTMTAGSGHNSGPGLTREGDSRITPLGRWLRAAKLDELPQFYNILRGDMSLVGPRPKLPQYEPMLNMPYRPGITGAATLAFRREEQMLRDLAPAELELFYAHAIKPLKARIDSRYMRTATLWTDLALIAATFWACVLPQRAPSLFRNRAPLVTALRSPAEQPARLPCA